MLIIAFFRFMEDRRLRWVYLGAVAYTVGYANHELMLLITTPMIGLALVSTLVWENFISRGEKPLTDALRSGAGPGLGELRADLPGSFHSTLYLALHKHGGPVHGQYRGHHLLAVATGRAEATSRGSTMACYFHWRSSCRCFCPLRGRSAGLAASYRRAGHGRWRGGCGERRQRLALRRAPVAGDLLPCLHKLLGSAFFLLYSYAGEKMPWLTCHIAMPLIILAGWFLNRFLTGVDWRSLFDRGGLLLVTAVPYHPAGSGALADPAAVGRGTSLAQQQRVPWTGWPC